MTNTFLEDLTWLAGCTGPDGVTPLIPGLRIGHPACMEHGTSQWPVCSTPNFGGSCAGRGWVAKQGAEAWWVLIDWLQRWRGRCIARCPDLTGWVVRTAIEEVQRMVEHGEAFAPKEEA